MMNNRKISSIFIGISTFLLALASCESPEVPKNSGTITLSETNDNPGDYPIVQPKQLDPETIHIDSLYIQVAYELKAERWLLVGKSIRDYPDGLKFLIVNPKDNNKLIYRSRGSWESWVLHPTFFKVNNPAKPMIILLAQGTSDSWGQWVFSMENDSIREIGYLDVARKEQADTAFYEGGFRLTDIGPFTQINATDKGLEFRFKTDSVFYYGRIGEQVDVTFRGDQIQYVFDGDSLWLEVDH